jgi:hypothetical protein
MRAGNSFFASDKYNAFFKTENLERLILESYIDNRNDMTAVKKKRLLKQLTTLRADMDEGDF